MKNVYVINFIKKYKLLFLFLLFCCLFFFHLSNLIQQFNEICLNKEFLTWDPNARMITSLQMAQSLKNFDIFSYFWFILDSPTWPVLRNIIESTLFLFIQPSSSITIYISVFFFIFTVILFFYFSFYKTAISFKRLFFSLSLLFLFCLNPSILLYTFSGMLELQGSFFIFISLFYFYRFLFKIDFLKNRYEKLIFIFSMQALFHTKYPYGFMFCFSIIIYYLLFELKFIYNIFFPFVQKTFKFCKKNIFFYISIAFFLIGLSFSIFNMHKGKSVDYFRYITVLFLLIHIFLYIFSEKSLFSRSIKGNKLYFLIKWGFFPIILWIMLHPDRFSSSKNTISHFQVGSTPQSFINIDFFTIYFKEIALNSLSISYFSIVLFLFFLLSLSLKLKKNLSFIFSFILLIHLVGLTFLTPNHQARHIYHLLPAFFFSLFYFLISIKNKLLLRVSYFVLLVQISYFTINYKYNLFSFNLCFSGKNTQYYTISRQAKDFIKNNINTDIVLLNFFHKHHLNKTDIDFLVYLNSFQKNLSVDSNLRGISKKKDIFIAAKSCSSIEKSLIENNIKMIQLFKKVENQELCFLYFRGRKY